MEAKLAEYRARKHKEAVKQFPYNIMTLNSQQHASDTARNLSPSTPQEDGNMSKSSLISHTSDGAELSDSNLSESTCPNFTLFTVITNTLYFLLWTTLYAVAVHLEFGTVYFIVSLLYAIWRNTGTGPKKDGEISAYSVFNPNCEAIDGTLKAEQFEQELRYGAGSVH